MRVLFTLMLTTPSTPRPPLEAFAAGFSDEALARAVGLRRTRDQP
jgi:hypothetical protein